jgi:holo-[acyl-carrier protein] synthase
VLETGVDIVEVSRVAELARRFGERFGRRVYSPDEWRQFRDQPHSLAARFAAKEAAIKALGSPNMALHEIVVARAEGQRPVLQLSGRAEARARALGVRQMAVSLSHSREYTVAVVVLERGPTRGE